MMGRLARIGRVGLLVAMLVWLSTSVASAQAPYCPPFDEWTRGRVPTLAALVNNGAVFTWLPTDEATGTAAEGVAVRLLDDLGQSAQAWESGPLVFEEGGLSSYPRLVSLDRRAFILSWDRFVNGGNELVQAGGRMSGLLPPPPSSLQDTVLSGASIHQSTQEVVAIDSTEAYVATGEFSGLMLRKLGVGTITVPGWPLSGVELGVERRLGGLALDDSGGVYVADCQLVPCFMPTDDCTTTVKVRRVLADATFDPRWGDAGRILGSGLPRGRSFIVMPDRAGGCYALWYGRHPVGLRLMRLLPDGSTAPGWPLEGDTIRSGFTHVPGRDLYGNGPQALVTASSDFLLPGVMNIDNLTPDFRVAILASGPLSGTPSGWTTHAVPLSDVVPLSTLPPVIGADSTSRAVVVWAHSGVLYANAIDTRTGQYLSGWPPTGRVLCPGPETRTEPALLVHEDGTFTVAWSELRAGVYGVRHGRFYIEDGTVATTLAARLTEHLVRDGWVEAEWSLSNAGGAAIMLQRAVDDAAFTEHEGLERIGATTIRLRDAVPAGARRLRYALRSGPDAISDTLTVTLGITQPPRLVAATLQRGARVELRLRLDAPQDWVEVALHDIAGRQVAKRRWSAMAAGEHLLEFEPSGARPGVLLARMRAADGTSVVRTIVRLTD